METFDVKGFRTKLAARLGVPVSNIVLDVAAASVSVTAHISPPSDGGGEAGVLQKLGTFTPATMSADLGVSVEALDPPSVSTLAIARYSPPPDPPPLPSPAPPPHWPPPLIPPAKPPSLPPSNVSTVSGVGAAAGFIAAAICFLAYRSRIDSAKKLRENQAEFALRQKQEEAERNMQETLGDAARRIQSRARGKGAREHVRIRRQHHIAEAAAAVAGLERDARDKLQGMVMGYFVRKTIRNMRQDVHRSAAVCIQAHARRFLVRRRGRAIAEELAALRLQTNWRMRYVQRVFASRRKWYDMGQRFQHKWSTLQRWRAMVDAALDQDDKNALPDISDAQLMARRLQSPVWQVLSATAMTLQTSAASAMAAAERLFIAPALPQTRRHLILCRMRMRLKPPALYLVVPLDRSPTLRKVQLLGVPALLLSTTLGIDAPPTSLGRAQSQRNLSQRSGSTSRSHMAEHGQTSQREVTLTRTPSTTGQGSRERLVRTGTSRDLALPHTVASTDLSVLPHAFRPRHSSESQSARLPPSQSPIRRLPSLDGPSTSTTPGEVSAPSPARDASNSIERRTSFQRRLGLVPELDLRRRLTLPSARASQRGDGSNRAGGSSFRTSEASGGRSASDGRAGEAHLISERVRIVSARASAETLELESTVPSSPSKSIPPSGRASARGDTSNRLRREPSFARRDITAGTEMVLEHAADPDSSSSVAGGAAPAGSARSLASARSPSWGPLPLGSSSSRFMPPPKLLPPPKLHSAPPAASSVPPSPAPAPESATNLNPRAQAPAPAAARGKVRHPAQLGLTPSNLKLARSRFNVMAETNNVAGEEVVTSTIPVFDPSRRHKTLTRQVSSTARPAGDRVAAVVAQREVMSSAGTLSPLPRTHPDFETHFEPVFGPTRRPARESTRRLGTPDDDKTAVALASWSGPRTETKTETKSEPEEKVTQVL